MRRYFIVAMGLLALAALAVLLFGVAGRKVGFEGSQVKGPDSYVLEFKEMNQEDSHTLALREGDALKVEFAIDRGDVDLIIGIPGEEAIYRGNGITSGSFVLTAPKEGEYRVTVRGQGAAGAVKVVLQGEE